MNYLTIAFVVLCGSISWASTYDTVVLKKVTSVTECNCQTRAETTKCVYTVNFEIYGVTEFVDERARFIEGVDPQPYKRQESKLVDGGEWINNKDYATLQCQLKRKTHLLMMKVTESK
ncbi:MAG: hypothetical protein AB7O96_18975 [Pseudobdellovibrionaceae bacterium]